MNPKARTYRDAGVDIAAGNKAVELIKSSVSRATRPEVITELGGFGGLFALDTQKYRQPVLVSGTDGVGTKLKLAIETDRHDTIGIDAVAMCVNDILVQGAEPLFFLDYLAVGRLLPEKVAAIVDGVAQGCETAGCALIGGETAEMPGMYGENEYDLAGFSVGVVEREKIIDGSGIEPGDVLLGLKSSGLHSNGFSLVRKVLLEDCGLKLNEQPRGLEKTLAEELLIPTRIYVPLILPLLQSYRLKGMAHITGGGLVENIPRMLPAGTAAKLKRSTWKRPPIFDLVRDKGNIALEEMDRTFNQGLGLILAVPRAEADDIRAELDQQGEEALPVGEITSGNREVIIE